MNTQERVSPQNLHSSDGCSCQVSVEDEMIGFECVALDCIYGLCSGEAKYSLLPITNPQVQKHMVLFVLLCHSEWHRRQ